MSKTIVGAVSLSENTLSGTIAKPQGLTGGIAAEKKLEGVLATVHTANVSTYTGKYEVTPKVEGQALKTKQKYMIDDVTVHAIPYFDVSNTAGGSTVYIGTEIELM